MHCNNGKFHEYITVGTNIYMTEHKHVGILGNVNYTQFGEYGINSYLVGNDVDVDGNKILVQGQNSIYITSPKGPIDLDAKQSLSMTSEDITSIKSMNKSVNINAKTYVNLNAESGITVPESCYGTTVPSSGVEGQVFFKLIS